MPANEALPVAVTASLKAAVGSLREASRINQYNMFLCRDFERLWSPGLSARAEGFARKQELKEGSEGSTYSLMQSFR